MIEKSTSAAENPRRLERPTIAVVIPTLNEANGLAGLIETLSNEIERIVVSDGGSGDETAAVAESLGAQVVAGPPGRGGQIRRGIDAVDADVLLVLHADTRLPAGAFEAVRAAVREGAVGGGFLVRFDSNRRLLALGSALVNLRTRWSRLPLGDQAQWFTREAYAAIGGFPDWPILEDLEFIRRLKRVGKISVLPMHAETSARRYLAQGMFRTVVTNWLIWMLYLLGVGPERLARLYRPHGAQASPPRE